MKTLKKLLAAMLALVMVLSMAACGGSGTTDQSISADSEAAEETAFQEIVAETVDTSRRTTSDSDERYPKVTVAISADPQDLNPWNVNSGTKGYVYCYIYESLFDYDAENYYPVLAKGYTVSDDGLQWDVQMYD